MLGWNISMEYMKKLRVLKDLILLFESMKSYIGYSAFKLADSLNNIQPMVSEREVKMFIDNIITGLNGNKDSFDNIWITSVNDYLSHYIYDDVSDTILSFSGITNYMDKSSQIRFLDMICDKLKEKEAQITKETLNKVKISRTIGLFAGVLVVIILL
ncbi:MAG: stage III sporulation protein AB [Lachnospira sp.]